MSKNNFIINDESFNVAKILSTLTKRKPNWASKDGFSSYGFYNINKSYSLIIDNEIYNPSYVLITNDENKNMTFHEVFIGTSEFNSKNFNTCLKAFDKI